MTPREWVGCVVMVRDPRGSGWCVTIRRAWKGKRTGRLTRVAFVNGDPATRQHEQRWTVTGVERRASGEFAGLRVLVLGRPW